MTPPRSASPQVVALEIDEALVRRVDPAGSGLNNLIPKHADAGSEIQSLAEQHPDAWIAWYDSRLRPFLSSVSSWPALAKHPLEILHAGFLQPPEEAASLGFVDFDSTFLLSAPAECRYATWLAAPAAGLAHSSVLRAVRIDLSLPAFPLQLFDFGYRGLRSGVCLYSEPRLLRDDPPGDLKRRLRLRLSAAHIAILVSRIYGRRAMVRWLLGNFCFEQRLPLWAWMRSGRYPSGRTVDAGALQKIHKKMLGKPAEPATVDVIIPTLNRRAHLADVLDDLARQSVVPQRVIVVEQQPERGAGAPEKEMASNHARNAIGWPFDLRHHVVNWAGACRARNLGLQDAESEWILFLDDDVRLPEDLIEYLLRVASAYGVDALNAATYLPNQHPEKAIPFSLPLLSHFFSGETGLARRCTVQSLGGFDERLEGGVGEDYDLGVRLQRSGHGILRVPGRPVLHKKAASGGFRHEVEAPWRASVPLPQPSPTLLCSRRKHASRQMQVGFALQYWAARLRDLPPHYWPFALPGMIERWKSAGRWATLLRTRI
jgi:hypothetical protein